MSGLTGQMLGQYQLMHLVGKGGMATIYLARQESMRRDVAVKVLATELVGDADFDARFRREAQMIANLQHPHILPVFDFGQQGDYVYLVMQWVNGGTLSDELREGPLSLNRAARLLNQIASALSYAHRKGVIHRDLKPANILLDDQGNAYLTDFGIAKMMAGTTNITASGHLMGTPAYMAPEQWRSQPVDARTDVYALGMIVYEMLVGLQPFEADTPYALMYDHMDKLPPSPVRYHPGLPSAIEPVLFKAIAKSPDARYASALELAEAFSEVVARAPNPDYRPNRPKNRFPPTESMDTYEDSTYQLPHTRPEDMPEWAKRLMGDATAESEHVEVEPPVTPPPFIAPPPGPRRHRPRRKSRLYRGMLVLLVVGVIIAVVSIITAGIVLNRERGTSEATATQALIAAAETEIATETAQTETSSPTQTAPQQTGGVIVQTATSSPMSTRTSSPLPSATMIPTNTLVPIPTATWSPMPSATQTPQPTNTMSSLSTITSPSPTLEMCLVQVKGNSAVNIRLGPGVAFRVVDSLVPGEQRPALLHTNTGFVYLDSGWIDDNYIELTPASVCALLPLISSRDSSAGRICTIRANRTNSDLRTAPDPRTDRLSLVPYGTTLTVFRVVQGHDGQAWYYAVTDNSAWQFGWMPASHAAEITTCPPPESE